MFPPGGYYSAFPRIRIRDGNLIKVYKPYLFKKKITKKMWCICTMAKYSAIKKNKIMPFSATGMHLEVIILNEVNKKGKDKCHMMSPKCAI